MTEAERRRAFKIASQRTLLPHERASLQTQRKRRRANPFCQEPSRQPMLIPDLVLTCSGTLTQRHNFFGPRFPHLQNKGLNPMKTALRPAGESQLPAWGGPVSPSALELERKLGVFTNENGYTPVTCPPGTWPPLLRSTASAAPQAS